ncbi:hypothetical protein QBC47DRAFT_408654 [Echria macrotheca]|uniref:Uncharacterized protein n=1 Tax=Echria macrotheca TaxID=438768 RepID=A0AAJ0BLQ8_9PEZI|nr:hypothetical protein QBC47DRAFT_408654 [Echria macrotheca]
MNQNNMGPQKPNGNPPEEAERLQVMMNDIGPMRVEELPLEDYKPNNSARPRAAKQPQTNKKWRLAQQNGTFDDEDAAEVKHLDPLGGGRAYDRNAVYNHVAPQSRHILESMPGVGNQGNAGGKGKGQSKDQARGSQTGRSSQTGRNPLLAANAQQPSTSVRPMTAAKPPATLPSTVQSIRQDNRVPYPEPDHVYKKMVDVVDSISFTSLKIKVTVYLEVVDEPILRRLLAYRAVDASKYFEYEVAKLPKPSIVGGVYVVFVFTQQPGQLSTRVLKFQSTTEAQEFVDAFKNLRSPPKKLLGSTFTKKLLGSTVTKKLFSAGHGHGDGGIHPTMAAQMAGTLSRLAQDTVNSPGLEAAFVVKNSALMTTPVVCPIAGPVAASVARSPATLQDGTTAASTSLQSETAENEVPEAEMIRKTFEAFWRPIKPEEKEAFNAAILAAVELIKPKKSEASGKTEQKMIAWYPEPVPKKRIQYTREQLFDRRGFAVKPPASLAELRFLPRIGDGKIREQNAVRFAPKAPEPQIKDAAAGMQWALQADASLNTQESSKASEDKYKHEISESLIGDDDQAAPSGGIVKISGVGLSGSKWAPPKTSYLDDLAQLDNAVSSTQTVQSVFAGDQSTAFTAEPQNIGLVDQETVRPSTAVNVAPVDGARTADDMTSAAMGSRQMRTLMRALTGTRRQSDGISSIDESMSRLSISGRFERPAQEQLTMAASEAKSSNEITLVLPREVSPPTPMTAPTTILTSSARLGMSSAAPVARPKGLAASRHAR